MENENKNEESKDITDKIENSKYITKEDIILQIIHTRLNDYIENGYIIVVLNNLIIEIKEKTGSVKIEKLKDTVAKIDFKPEIEILATVDEFVKIDKSIDLGTNNMKNKIKKYEFQKQYPELLDAMYDIPLSFESN